MRLIHERAYIIGNAFSTAAYIRERLIFESGLLSRRYGIPKNCLQIGRFQGGINPHFPQVQQVDVFILYLRENMPFLRFQY